MNSETKQLNIEKFGTKWLVDWYGKNKIPDYFASYLRNVRIDNSSITLRKWFKELGSKTWWTHIQWLISNAQLWLLLTVLNKKLYSVNVDNWTFTEIWTVSTTDKQVNFIVYWKYTIILNWEDYPYVYDGSTLTQLTWTVIDDIKPIYWDRFAWFTCVAGNTEDTKNILYISRPITLANPEYAYDYKGSGSWQITFQSEILGVKWTLNSLYIFTKEAVNIINKSQIDTTGWIWSFYAVPIWDWGELATHRSIINAWDKVFYLTKDNQIRTIWYISWTVDAQIWTLSNKEQLNIKWFLENLNSDQSDCYAILNKRDNTIEWNMKTANSPDNDITIIYDLTNTTWLVDNNKYFIHETELNNIYYTWSALDWTIYINNTWYLDEEQWIPFEYYTQELNFWNPVIYKQFRWFEIAGEISEWSNIQVDFVVDNNIIYTWFINNDDLDNISSEWIASSEIWWEEISWSNWIDLYPFNKIATASVIRKKGKQAKIIITSTEPWTQYYFDYLSIFVRPLRKYEKFNKFS